MKSVYDIAIETRKKCGSRYDPVEYAVSMAGKAADKESAEQWLKVADVLKDWSRNA